LFHCRLGAPVSAVAADAAAVKVPFPRAGAGADEVLSGLWVPKTRQWASTTSGRIAGDGYSWMQAVHWVVGSGLYEPRRSHGPKMGPTTVLIAQFLAELTPCRPGVDYLMRRTGLEKRSVQYHLERRCQVERGLQVWDDHRVW
jgi:hypothetical protein